MTTRTALSSQDYYERIRKYAEDHGGLLLSTEYVNSATPMQFRCAKGHEWSSSSGSMWFQQSWCLTCRRTEGGERRRQRRNYLEELQAKAAAHGGKCLATGLIRSHDKLRFQCAHGHEWEALAGVVNRGSWCPYCQRFKIENPLGELQAIAAQRGGQCVSTEYIRSHIKLRFRCADGHEWESRPNDIRRGTWCPSCTNKTESLVRQFLECVYGIDMPSKRLPWLIDSTGKQRVLDGYCEQAKFAFEYHGEQHFSHIAFFHEHESEKTLAAQQRRDAFVRHACQEQGVTLLEVTNLPDGYTQAQFVAHMQAAIADLPTAPAEMPGGLALFLSMPLGVGKLEQLRALAASKGGLCLAQKYISSAAKVSWQCEKGHVWQAVPKSIRKGHWCPYCSQCRRLSPLEDMHRVAADRGGICHATQYVNMKSPVDCTCAAGHQFTSSANALLHAKQWCPVCSGNRLENPLERLRQIAQAKGGSLLSTEYVNSQTKVALRCAHGHEWQTTPLSLVHRDTWCHSCARSLSAKLGAAKRQQKPGSLTH